MSSLYRSDASKNAALDAELALLNSGSMRLYEGTVPADESTALSGNDLLVTLVLSATAFASAASGQAAANSITNGTGLAAAGAGVVATFYRALATDDTTVHRQGKVFQTKAALTTVQATATGFDDSADGLFDEIAVGDKFDISGFSDGTIDAVYEVVSKTDSGTIATCPVPAATEAAGQSVTFTPDGLVLDNTTIAESQTVSVSAWTVKAEG